MTNRIQGDHKRFHNVIRGRSRQELKKLFKSGSIVKMRPKGDKLLIPLPKIDIPRLIFGEDDQGVGRGPGKKGDVVARDPQKGNKPGTDTGEGIQVQIDMEDVLEFMEEDLKLPKMKPKPIKTFDQVKIRYNNISKVGLNSLRHMRRTMKEAIKRSAMSGDSDNLQKVPGSSIPIKVTTPIKSDFRYRQYKEIVIPSSDAVVIFARDCSGSMDDYRCEIASDMSWWIDIWIRKFYKKVERCYFIHDAVAEEVDEEKFYKYRMNGGTYCSSVFDKISHQFENRFPPDKFNIYVFYFTDGDNYSEDNDKMLKIIKERFGDNVVNLLAITQICSVNYKESVKQIFDTAISDGFLPKDQIKTVSIGAGGDRNFNWGSEKMTDEERNKQIIDAIRKLLSEKESKSIDYYE